jgi:hypothetical protein
VRHQLQKVVASAATPSWNRTLVFGNGTEDAEFRAEIFANVHDRCNIAAAITVVRCRPDRNNRLLGEVVLQKLAYGVQEEGIETYLVAFVNELMSTSDKLQTIDMIEFGRNLVSKEPTCAARRNSPCLNVLRVAPNQVAESTFVRDLLGASNNTNLIDGSNLRAQSTMNTENLTVNNSSQDEKIKNLAAGFPNRCISILLLALLVETVNLGDLTGFMIASDEGNLVGVSLHYY